MDVRPQAGNRNRDSDSEGSGLALALVLHTADRNKPATGRAVEDMEWTPNGRPDVGNPSVFPFQLLQWWVPSLLPCWPTAGWQHDSVYLCVSSCLIPRARATVTHACGLVRATGFDHWEPYERDARHSESGLDSDSEQHHVRHWLWQARERPPSWSRHQASKPHQ